jgi:hypothetical protein
MKRVLAILGVPLLLVIPAFFVDRVIARQKKAEQLRVLRVTMLTVQDIVNNNLNRLQPSSRGGRPCAGGNADTL